MWREVLAQAGVTVETVDAAHMRLRAGDREQVVLLREIPYPIAPSQVPARSGEPGLLVLPRTTPHVIEVAAEHGWDVVTDSGMVSLRIARDRSVQAQGVRTPRRTPRRRGPAPWATFTVARRLLAAPASSQAELAARSHVTQPKVSRVLATLGELGLVERAAGEWRPSDWERLFDWWLANYPAPGGVTSYWCSLDDIATQARKAVQAIPPHAQPVVSGDAAADMLAPWRRPNRSTIYARTGAALAEAGFVAVGSLEEASLVLCAPADPGVWLPRSWVVRNGLSVADPLQIAYDIARGPDSDRAEAVEHLRSALQRQLASSWGESVTTHV